MKRREVLKGLIGSLPFASFLTNTSFASYIPRVERVRYSVGTRKTRIVLDLTGRIERTSVKSFLRGKKLYVDVHGLRTNWIRKDLKGQLTKNFRLFPMNHHLSRLEVSLKDPHAYKVFALKPSCGRPFRLVVDILPEFSTTSCKVRTNTKRIVVIDPGHGGRDPGAVWPINSRHPVLEEKHVTLPISKKVAYLLSRDKNIKVIMTRQKDVYVPLLRRAEIAAKSCADAFVSIHADSMPNYPNWDGVTVFKASPRLFEKAESTAKAVARHVKLCSNTMCWSISPLLLNMSTTVTFVESSKLASFVVKSMKAKVNDNLVNGIKNMQRNILVLKTPGRPAILIETGFMTNRLDRHRLFENGYQWKIAKGISRGIRNYLELLNTVALES